MKLLRTIIPSLFVLLSASVQSQTADQIINKHIEAIGGKEVINKIKSMITYSELSVMGSNLSSTSTVLIGKGFKNVANFNGQEIIQCVTPTGGWMINPLAGATEPQILPEDQVKAGQSSFDVGGDMFNYKAKGSTVELAGRETIEGVNTYKLKLVTKDAKQAIYFIDPSTYYVIKRETTTKANSQDITATSIFSNYKKTDFGMVVPYTTITNQGFEMTVTIDKIEFNKKIDPKIFEIPK